MEKFYFSERKHGAFKLTVFWKNDLAPVASGISLASLNGYSPPLPHSAICRTNDFSEKILDFMESCLEGNPCRINDDLFDISGLTDFQKKVLQTLRKNVPAGKVITYSGLAALAGCPGGARAVGTVMRENPFPLYFPCHRVIKSDATPGEYQPGRDVKKYLLKKENVVMGSDGRIDSECIEGSRG